MDTIYISAYLCHKYDQHKNVKLDSDDFQYIEEYYNSIVKNNLNTLIIIDDNTNDFILKYSNNNVKIIKVNPMNSDDVINNKLLLHDHRFIYFNNMLKSVTNKFTMFTDIGDVIVLNPIYTIIDINPKLLYVGTENEKINDNKWFIEYLQNMQWLDKSILRDYKIIFKNKTILNCGIIFGSRIVLLPLLSKIVYLTQSLYKMYRIDRPLDMFLINYVCYKFFGDILYDGTLLNTRFGHYEYDMNKAIKHK
jgi:hypothetical protein